MPSDSDGACALAGELLTTSRRHVSFPPVEERASGSSCDTVRAFHVSYLVPLGQDRHLAKILIDVVSRMVFRYDR